ncbi:MAG: hypothetical protein R2712_03590 [Vicinamibacterales bacterium]
MTAEAQAFVSRVALRLAPVLVATGAPVVVTPETPRPEEPILDGLDAFPNQAAAGGK